MQLNYFYIEINITIIFTKTCSTKFDLEKDCLHFISETCVSNLFNVYKESFFSNSNYLVIVVIYSSNYFDQSYPTGINNFLHFFFFFLAPNPNSRTKAIYGGINYNSLSVSRRKASYRVYTIMCYRNISWLDLANRWFRLFIY